MDIEQMKQDFQELCDKAEAFMKKYGEDHSYLVITNKEVKVMTCERFKEFEKENK